jgi:hypothetical protein
MCVLSIFIKFSTPDYTQTKDFVDETWFLDVKLGVARPFEFADAETGEILFNQVLEAGTGVWVRATGVNAANVRVTHGVPVLAGPCGPSGSLVFRCINTVMSYATMRRKVARAAAAKARAAAAKEAEALEFAAYVLRNN